MTAPSFIDSGNERLRTIFLQWAFKFEMCQQTFTNVLFCSIVGIIRNEIYFCGFYRCVNAGESLTNLHIDKNQKIKFHSFNKRM